MSSLTYIEKQKLELELGMSSGYVLDFTNRKFEQFFREVVGIEIFSDYYDRNSGSKANRMRAFWDLASDNQIIIFLNGLIEAWEIHSKQKITDKAVKLFEDIIKRLTRKINPEKKKQSEKSQGVNIHVYDTLKNQLVKLTNLKPIPRGFAFEKFLKEMFEASGLSPRAGFRLDGEQIDGSFILQNETYLLEAKWQNKKCGAGDLHIFEGKVNEKASWARGLFISHSGFTEEGLRAFRRNKKIICMDGLDLYEILRMNFSLEKILTDKVRFAAETGRPYVSFRELYGSI